MIEIRRAKLADLPFIRRLTLETAGLGIPEGRDVEEASVREGAAQAMDGLEMLLYKKKQLAILVAVEGEKPVGFLILEFNHVEECTGEKQSYIYNLAVDPNYYGHYVGHKLVRHAARVSSEHGHAYMTARVTASNERALLSALKLGFEIERYQITMACGPEGIAKMPGRPFHQRSHAISRLLRQRKRAKKPGEQA